MARYEGKSGGCPRAGCFWIKKKVKDSIIWIQKVVGGL